MDKVEGVSKLPLLPHYILSDSEYICPSCDGTGRPTIEAFNKRQYIFNVCGDGYALATYCSVCAGRGKVDWLDNILNGHK